MLALYGVLWRHYIRRQGRPLEVLAEDLLAAVMEYFVVSAPAGKFGAETIGELCSLGQGVGLRRALDATAVADLEPGMDQDVVEGILAVLEESMIIGVAHRCHRLDEEPDDGVASAVLVLPGQQRLAEPVTRPTRCHPYTTSLDVTCVRYNQLLVPE